jgi:hypothetical protein
MLETVGSELVEAVAVDPAFAVRVPAPEGVRVAVGPWTAATVLRVLAPIVAGAELLAVGIGPGRELGAIASHVQVLEVNELEVDGAGDKAGIKDGLQGLLVAGEGSKVGDALEDVAQGRVVGSTLQETVDQTVDDALMGA